MEKKKILKKYCIRLTKAINSEARIRKELESDRATLKYITSQKEAGNVLEESSFESYDEWTDTIEKQIKVGENTLANIAFKKIELEALNYYIQQNS